MKAFLLAVAVTSVVVVGDFLTNYDVPSVVDFEKARFPNNFLQGVWYRSNEAIVESREKLLKLYTHYTLQQAEQVVEHIAKYTNFTQVEAADKRRKALSSKNMTRVMELTDCIFKAEGSTIQAYKMTGYNLHNCIRMAQIETETRYLEIVTNFERLKNISLELNDYHRKQTENCVDKKCELASWIQYFVQSEKMKEEIDSNLTEVNNVNTRYLLSHIALGCVSSSLIQIEENYLVGKGLVEDCFSPRNDTVGEEPSRGGNRTVTNSR